jgi:hypothetical protein
MKNSSQSVGDVSNSILNNVNVTNPLHRDVKSNTKQKKKNEYLNLFLIIIAGAIVFWILAVLSYILFGVVISSDSIILTFVGILATFVVVSQYIQLKEIKEDVSDTLNKKILDINHTFLGLYSDLYFIKGEFFESLMSTLAYENSNINDVEESIISYFYAIEYSLQAQKIATANMSIKHLKDVVAKDGIAIIQDEITGVLRSDICLDAIARIKINPNYHLVKNDFEYLLGSVKHVRSNKAEPVETCRTKDGGDIINV